MIKNSYYNTEFKILSYNTEHKKKSMFKILNSYMMNCNQGGWGLAISQSDALRKCHISQFLYLKLCAEMPCQYLPQHLCGLLISHMFRFLQW